MEGYGGLMSERSERIVTSSKLSKLRKLNELSKLNKLRMHAKLLPEYIAFVEGPHPRGCIAEIIQWQFPNKYGASLTWHSNFPNYSLTYGRPELAILYDNELCSDTDITSDIIVCVSVPALALYLARIRGLAGAP